VNVSQKEEELFILLKAQEGADNVKH